MTKYKTASLDLRLGDCMDLMRDTPDGFYDLAIVDPPYGIGMSGQEWNNTPVGTPSIKGKSKGLRVTRKDWDDAKPTASYWSELARVSRNQIAWGGNYFTDFLSVSRGWICWDKKQPDGLTFSQFELAWTSFDTICRTFSMYATHVAQGVKIHPTQKPVTLYRWLLANYGKPGQRILDTHLGSGSIAIACHYFGAHLTATEIDPDYFTASVERIKRETRQVDMFTPELVVTAPHPELFDR